MDYEMEREIDILDLIFFVLEKWKLYILVGVIALIVCAGYKYYTSEKDRASNEALIAEGREDEVINSSAYQSALDALQEQEREIRELEAEITNQKVDITEYRNEIASNKDTITTYQESLKLQQAEKEEIERKLAELQLYMADSVLLKIDATSKPVAKKSYQVVYSGTGAEELFRDPVDEILAGYTQNISLIGIGSELAGKYGIPEKFLDETYSVEYDEISNTILVEATGVNREMAEDIRSAVCKLLEDRKQGMESRYHAHSLKSISEEYAEVVDEKLANTQSSRYNMENSYKSQIANYEAAILNTQTSIDNTNSSIETLERQITDAEDSIEEYNEDILKLRKKIIEDKLEEKVEAKKPSKLRSLKDGIKSGLIVAVVLAFLAAGIYCGIYLLDGKLHYAGDMEIPYGVSLLAVLCRPAVKGCFIDRWIWRMRNRGWDVPYEEVMKKAAVSLEKLVGEEKKVAILSTLHGEDLEKVREDLKTLLPFVDFVSVADSFSSSASAETLAGVDSVLVYEKREVSRNLELEAELAQAKLLEKRVLGSIVA